MKPIRTNVGRKLPPPIDARTQAAIDRSSPHILRDSPRFMKRRRHPDYDPANHTAYERQCYHCGEIKLNRDYYQNGNNTYRPECIACFTALRQSRHGQRCTRCGTFWQYGVRTCEGCERRKREKACARWLGMPMSAFQAWYTRLRVDLDTVEAMIRERERRVPRRGRIIES